MSQPLGVLQYWYGFCNSLDSPLRVGGVVNSWGLTSILSLYASSVGYMLSDKVTGNSFDILKDQGFRSYERPSRCVFIRLFISQFFANSRKTIDRSNR